MASIIALDNELKEHVLYSGEAGRMIKILNILATRFGYVFKKDTSLYGGYYVAKTGICYFVR